MGDVGIDLLKPKYEKRLLTQADLAYWEATYADGTVDREIDGAKYAGIRRGLLRSFRIVHAGEIVFEAFPPPGVSGRNLIYRRRTLLETGGNAGRAVFYIIGWAPMGPLFGVDLDHDQFWEDTATLLPSLTPMTGEPDDLLVLK